MAKKKEEKITEEVELEITEATEEEIVNSDEDVKTDESSIETPVEESNKEKITEEVELEILVAFTDKYTGKSYKIGETHPFNKDRAKELLKDSRKLVK